MAKRRKPGRQPASAQKMFDQVLATIPSEAEFEITMDADSTNEVWDDIDTNLQDGEAWLVYGGLFVFENIDPTTPAILDPTTADNAYTLQVHRNDDSEILLNYNDDDLMFHWNWTVCDTVNASQVVFPMPLRFGKRTITFSEKLRVLFRTRADDADLSVASTRIAGCLLYDRIAAPSIGQSKLGQIADL